MIFVRIATAVGMLILSGMVDTADAAGTRPVAFHLGPVAVLGASADRLELGIGAFNVKTFNDRTRGDTVAEAQVEYRFGNKLPVLGSFLGPAVGGIANTDGGVFGYAGLYSDLAIGDVVITPMVAAGAYEEGDGKDLGGTFQFRVALTAAYELDSGSRIGLRIAHMSNGYTHDQNPGEEEILATYSIPLGPTRSERARHRGDKGSSGCLRRRPGSCGRPRSAPGLRCRATGW